MNHDIFQIISVVSFVLSGILLVFSIFWFFKFHIWGIIGDLSGRTAKKSIAQMRVTNEKAAKSGLKLQKKVEDTVPLEKISTPPVPNQEEINLLETEPLKVQERTTISLEMIQNIILIHTEESI